MNVTLRLRTLPETEAAGLDVRPAGVVDLRRDIAIFVDHVLEKGLVRTRRGNDIPLSAARKLAKLLSHAGEAAAVEVAGSGCWSDRIAGLGRELGIVSYDVEGQYLGYSSSERSFPDNAIAVAEKAWRSWLSKPALEKERAILDALVKTAESEFFYGATLIPGARFDSFGSATGPAGKMSKRLPPIRRRLFELLAGLESGIWYETRSLVEWLEEHESDLILHRSEREPDDESRRRILKWERERPAAGKKRAARPEPRLADIYTNFRERAAGESAYSGNSTQITSQTVEAFHRVEGRYVEFFLCEIPYLCGFVELGLRGAHDAHGRDVSPSFERLRGFRLTQRFFDLMRGDAGFNRVKVTVLPNFEILVEAASYPEATLQRLRPYTVAVQEDGPIHRLRLDRKKVVEVAARTPAAPPLLELLAELTQLPLPENVAGEVARWTERGEKVTLYEGFGLVELVAEEGRAEILRDLGKLAEPGSPVGFALVRDAEQAFRRLEERLHVPVRVKHRQKTLALSNGRLSTASQPPPPGRKAGTAEPPRAVAVRLVAEDLVGYRASDRELLQALHEALRPEAKTCLLSDDGLLVFSAEALGRLRATLRKLKDRFDVTLETRT